MTTLLYFCLLVNQIKMTVIKDESKSREEVKTVSDIVGSWGPWQLRIFIGYTLVYITNPFINLGLVFMAPRIDFWCKTGVNVMNASTHKQCEVFNNKSVKCDDWSYDHSVFTLTAVEEFDLVCDRSWMISASTSAYQLGYAISSLFTGHLSDRFGRLFTLKFCVIFEIFAGYAQAFSMSAVHFLAARLFLGVFAFGKFFTGYVLLIEVVGPKTRSRMSCVSEAGWILGSLFLPLAAYLLPHFRYLQICVSTFSLFAVGFLWIGTESPRWLIANGRIEEAEAIVLEAARKKGKFSDEEVRRKFAVLTKTVASDESSEKMRKQQTIFDMWKVPTLLKYCLVFYILFCINGLVNYSLSMNVGELGGNIFLNNFFYSLTGTANTVILYFLLPRMNRRKIHLVAMLLGGAAMFATIPFIGDPNGTSMRVISSMLGKFFVGVGFHLVYLQAAEIFPTTLRQLGVGSCTLASRVGSIVAPFSKEFNDATHPAASMMIFGVLAFLGGILNLILPETRGKEVPATVEQAKVAYTKRSEEPPTAICLPPPIDEE